MRARNDVAAAFAVLAAALLPLPLAAQPVAALDIGPPRAVRLLVISPHPDDGALGGAGLIARVGAGGGAVHVIQITSGDAFANGVKAEAKTDRPTADDYRRYGALREHETIGVLATLGLPRRAVTFLGFPDDGLCRLVSDFRSTTLAFESPYTKRASPPSPEQIVRGVAYRGEDAERELERLVASFKPTIVLIPDARDEHPDHCSTHLLAHEALDAVSGRDPRQAPRVLHYLIHYGAWPDAAAEAAGTTLAPPERLRAAPGTAWKALTLTPREIAAKARALSTYRSQMLAIGAFLESFNRGNELFSEGDPDGAVPCWCRGQDIVNDRLPPAAPRTARP